MEEEDEDLAAAIAMSMGDGSAPASPPPTVPSTATAVAATAHGEDQEATIIRRVIPADNSCLFNAVGYALEGGAKDRGMALRETAAALVLSAPGRWGEAELGRSCEEYADWIQDTQHWGGGIELAVLSEHFGTELAAFDCQTARVHVFGQDKGYRQRALFIYDGIHYDVLVRQLFAAAPPELDVTLFDVNDEVAMAQAKALAVQAQSALRFTDTSRFTLRCVVCQKGLVGQEEAVLHAKATGHANFAEFRS
eukprot:TRINITY_DN55498_c0_g1_i1.p1 TRINITY_DN55498_c0_g1~~TRINITY_DN55498_c0_g1_i1.p1  ORF type:complete len:268 (-),score=66.12 TRINITY_DN55498_c0_g1_i1:36-788(-)